MPRIATALGLSAGRYGGVAFTGLLDAYTSGLAGVWCVPLRLLASYNGPLIRVRSSSGGGATEQDIYPDAAGYLDTVSLSSFIGANSGYVTKVYDQSGVTAGWDLGETTASKQGCIVNAGSIETLGGVGLPAISLDTTDGLRTSEKTNYTGNDMTLMTFGDNSAQRVILGVTRGVSRVDATSGCANIGRGGLDNWNGFLSGALRDISPGSVIRTFALTSDATNGVIYDRSLSASAAHASAMNYTRMSVFYYQSTASWGVSGKWNFGALWESVLSAGTIDTILESIDTAIGYS